MKKRIVFYDGGCPLCRREIAHYQKLDRDQNINWQDISQSTELLDAHGIAWADAMQRMVVLDADGTAHSGAHAFVCLWQALPYYRVMGNLFGKMPPLVRLMDRAYNIFARRRWKKRCADGVCPPG